jgi:DNA-binding transcriptional ArsR family regulator
MEIASKPQVDRPRTDNDMGQILKMATQLLSNPDALRVFRAVEEGRGKASGWSIARTVGGSPDEVQNVLKELRDNGVIDSTDAGLDGYYSLTKEGFALRERLPIAV